MSFHPFSFATGVSYCAFCAVRASQRISVRPSGGSCSQAHGAACGYSQYDQACHAGIVPAGGFAAGRLYRALVEARQQQERTCNDRQVESGITRGTDSVVRIFAERDSVCQEISDENAFTPAVTRLQAGSQPVSRAELPFLSKLFGLRRRGNPFARRMERQFAGRQAAVQMSSLASWRTRPRSCSSGFSIFLCNR